MANLVPWPITFTAAVGVVSAIGFVASLAEDVPPPRIPSEAPLESFRTWKMAYIYPGQRSAPFMLEAPSRDGRLSCIVYTTSEPEGGGAKQEIRELYNGGGNAQWRANESRVIIRPNSNIHAMAVRYRNVTDRGIYVFVRQIEGSREGACGRVVEDHELPRPQFPPVAHTYQYYFSGNLGSPEKSSQTIASRDIEERQVTIINGGDQSRPYKVESGRNVHRCLVWNASLPSDELHRLPLMRAVLNERWFRVSSEVIQRTAASEAEQVVYQTYYFSFDNQTSDQVVVEVGAVSIPRTNDSSACGYNPELLGRPRYEESRFVSGVWREKD